MLSLYLSNCGFNCIFNDLLIYIINCGLDHFTIFLLIQELNELYIQINIEPKSFFPNSSQCLVSQACNSLFCII